MSVDYDGVPAGLVIDIEMAPSTWIDVSDYVERSSFKVEWSTDRYASRLSFKLDKRGGGTFSGHAIADWQRIKVYDTAHNPPGLPVGAYTRYFLGFTQILASDNPLGVDKAWNITCVDMALLLTQGPYAITTLWPDIDGSPAGISDQDLLWNGFTISGVPYNGLIPSYAPDLYTTLDISVVISSLPHLKFENMTVLDAINLIKGQASSTEAPRFYVTIADDWYDGVTHLDHENWNPLFSWFDESSIGYSAPINELTDALTLTGGQAHWSTMSVNSDGTRVINRQTVSGDLESQATVNDTASQTAYGRIITGKPVVDTSLKTNAECTAKAQAFINAFKTARRTVQVTCYDQVSSAILRQPFKLKLTNALEGFSATDFAVVRASLQIDAAGVAYYAFDCGVSFIELSDTNLPSFVGGGSGLDLTPPPVPTGLVTLENVYEGQSHSSRWHIDWDDNSIVADFDYFVVDWYYFNGSIWHHEQVSTTVSNLNILNLTPGQTYYAEVRALDTSGNTSHYCTPISVVAAARDNPNPPTGHTQSSTGQGNSITAAWSKQVWALPSVNTADTWEVWYSTTNVNRDYRRAVFVDSTSTGVVIDGVLFSGLYYYFKMRGVTQYGDVGSFTTPIHVLVGYAPSPTNIIPNFDQSHPDAIILGWEVASTNTDTGLPSIVSTPLVAGLNRVRFAPANTETTAWQTLPIAGMAGQEVALGIAYVSNAAVGSNAVASAYIDAYSDGVGATLLTSQTLFNGAVNTTVLLYENKKTLPANTVVWRLRLEGAALASGIQIDFSLWDHRPATTVASTGLKSVLPAALHLLADGSTPVEVYDPSTGEVVGRVYFSSGVMVVHAIAYSGGEVGLDFRNSRGQGLIIPKDTDSGGIIDLFSEGGISVLATGQYDIAGIPVNITGAIQSVPAFPTGNFTADNTATVYYIDATAANRVATLEVVNTCPGRIHVFVKTDSTAHTVTVQVGTGTNTINGVGSIILTSQYDILIVQSNGSLVWEKWLSVVGGSSGVVNFTDLGDAPHSYSGQQGQPPVVNSAETGLIFGLRPSASHPLLKKDASTSDIREQEYYDGSGNYVRIGVLTGGVHVGQKLLNSRGDGLIIPWNTNTSGVFDIFTTRDINVAAGRDLFLNAGRDLFLNASAALALSSGSGAINVSILSSDPGSPINGDVWVLNSGGVRSLKARIGGVTYILGSTGFGINPMTTAGDLIVGGSGGAPTRMPIASDGQFLQTAGGVVVWGGPPVAPTPIDEFTDFSVGSSQISATPHYINTSGGGPGNLQVTLQDATGAGRGWQVRFVIVDATYGVDINVDSHDTGIRTLAGDVSIFTMITAGQTLMLESDGVGVWYIVPTYL